MENSHLALPKFQPVTYKQETLLHLFRSVCISYFSNFVTGAGLEELCSISLFKADVGTTEDADVPIASSDSSGQPNDSLVLP